MVLIILTALTFKHFVCDFLYQPPFMWQNKGTYGHVGGIAHALLHSGATFAILGVLAGFSAYILLIAVAEFVIHYHMDWFKMKYNKYKGWGATTHNQFWILLGVDQLVHSLTYIGIVAILMLHFA